MSIPEYIAHPFSSRAFTAINESIRHIHEVRAMHPDWDEPVILIDVVNSVVTWDEDTTPRTEAQFTCKIPDTVEEIDALDPRKRVEIEVLAGYVYPGGDMEMHRVFRGDLRRRQINRPAGTMTLDASGYEVRLLDTLVFKNPLSYPWDFPVQTAIAQLIYYHAGTEYEVFEAGNGATVGDVSGEDVVERLGESPWNLIADLADRDDVSIYFSIDANGWMVERNPEVQPEVKAILKTGPDGTITDSTAVLDREGFYNSVFVRHTWDGGESHGFAIVRDGEFGTNNVGFKALSVERNVPASAFTSRATARAMVQRGISRGRSVEINSAAAAYWLRPGHTVEIQLPTGDAERHLVTAVRFDIPLGTMHLSTRVPQDIVIDSGE